MVVKVRKQDLQAMLNYTGRLEEQLEAEGYDPGKEFRYPSTSHGNLLEAMRNEARRVAE